jgi:hypothetical protein
MTEEYIPEPTMVQVVIAELKKLPDKILELSAGNFRPEELIVQAIGETLQVVEKFMDISYLESDLIPTSDPSDGMQLERVAYAEQVDNLAQQYWDSVSN